MFRELPHLPLPIHQWCKLLVTLITSTVGSNLPVYPLCDGCGLGVTECIPQNMVPVAAAITLPISAHFLILVHLRY